MATTFGGGGYSGPKRHFNTNFGYRNEQASKASGRKIGGLLPSHTARRALTQGMLPSMSGATSALGMDNSPTSPLGGVVDSPPAEPAVLGGKGPGEMGAAPMGIGSDNATAGSTQGAGKSTGIGGESGRARRDATRDRALASLRGDATKTATKAVIGGVRAKQMGFNPLDGVRAMLDPADLAAMPARAALASNGIGTAKAKDWKGDLLGGVVDYGVKTLGTMLGPAGAFAGAVAGPVVRDLALDWADARPYETTIDFNEDNYGKYSAKTREMNEKDTARNNVSGAAEKNYMGGDFGGSQQRADNPSTAETHDYSGPALGMSGVGFGPAQQEADNPSFNGPNYGKRNLPGMTSGLDALDGPAPQADDGRALLGGAVAAKAASEKAKQEKAMVEASRNLAEKTARSLTTGTGITSGPGIHSPGGYSISMPGGPATGQPQGFPGLSGGPSGMGGRNGVSGSGGRGSGSGGQNNGSGPDRGGSGYGGR